ncbi:MAG: hypothetical protein PVH88_07040 [Ignavibacteria bacterium]|jgi:hypothetical protein
MIEGISSSSSLYNIQQTSNEETSLTEEQKKQLEEILAKYDSEDMDEESRKAMMEEIKKAGFEPSREVDEMLNEAGFEPPEKLEGDMPAPLEESGEKEVPQFISDFIQQYEAGDTTQEELDSFLQKLEDMGISNPELVLDEKA